MNGLRLAAGLPATGRRLAAPGTSGIGSADKTELAETQDYIEFSWAGEDARLQVTWSIAFCN